MDHQTFAQLLGNYGEFFGSIAVVATLAYLARQVQQSSQLSRMQLNTGGLESFSRFRQMQNENPEVVVKMESGAQLSETENIIARNIVLEALLACGTTYDNSKIADPTRAASIVSTGLRLLERFNWPLDEVVAVLEVGGFGEFAERLGRK